MSSFRVTPASRVVEPGRQSAQSAATPADPSTKSFPEVLGGAVNVPDMTQTGRGGSSTAHGRQQNAAERDAIGGSAAEPGNRAAATTAKDADLHSQHRRKHASSLGAMTQASVAALATTMLSGPGPEPATQALSAAEKRREDSSSGVAESIARNDPVAGSTANSPRTAPNEAANELNSEEGASRELSLQKGADVVIASSADSTGLSLTKGPVPSTSENQAGGSSESPSESSPPVVAATTRSTDLPAAPSTGQSPAGPPANNDGDSGLAAALSVASGVGLVDRSHAADASLPRPALRMSGARSQGVTPDEGVSNVVARLAVPSPSQESAGSTNPVNPEFAGMFSDRPELEPNSDISGQPLVAGARPPAPGAADRTPSRSALPVGEDRIRVALPNLVADVQTAETGNIVSSGLPGAASSPSAAADVFPVGLSAQLFHHVMGSVASGGQEIVLQLHPPELGDLTVRVLVHGREVSAWFATPQIQVQQAISQALGQLQTDLGNVGYNLATASIGADAWSPSGSPGERDEGSLTPQQQGAINRSSGERSSGGPRLSSASGVSIYV